MIIKADDVLQLENLSVDFAGLRALDGVSLSLEAGEVVGLIGPNGSGKTTLLNAITGFVRPSGGTVRCDGQTITGWPPHRVAGVGIRRTFQTIRLFKELTVLENVEVAAAAVGLSLGAARRTALDALEQVGVGHLADLSAGALPYGAERRVEIARALAARPRYLLLDEPAAGLNEAESDALLGQLGEIRAGLGCGILIVDHDMRLIMRLCGRLHVLNYGRTISHGAPDDVGRDPQVISAYLGTAAQEATPHAP